MNSELFDPYYLHKKLHATGFINPKATTLFFDRVWIPCDITEYNSDDFNSISKLIERDSVGFFKIFIYLMIMVHWHIWVRQSEMLEEKY